jgi:hypothetical protein
MPPLRLLSILLAALVVLVVPTSASAAEPDARDSLINRPSRPVALKPHAEMGFLGQISHKLQLGEDGTYVDVRKDLGQDTLYFFARLSGDLDIGKRRRHTVSLLWQPLDITSDVVLDRDIQVEDQTIAADTPLTFRYGFSFWRLSYLFDTLKDDREVAVGLGLQIRNANIVYATKDGEVVRGARDVGPVPLLKFRGRGYLAGKFWMGGEIDGFYAPIRYINGANSDVEGAIVDASVRFGLTWKRGIDTFINVRYLGGGAQGTGSSEKAEAYSDGFTRNWLHFMTLSLGVSLL